MAQVFANVAGATLNINGDLKETCRDFSFDAAATYATNGVPIAAGDMGLNSLITVEVIGGNAESCKYLIRWNPTTGKLLFFFTDVTPLAPLIQVTNGTTITNVTLRLRATGY